MNELSLNNNTLASIARNAAPKVIDAIRTASSKTGVNFAYLIQQAAAESSFDAKAESRTSSAAGLYQFIESTWMDMVKKYGDKYGLEKFSAQISDGGKVADADLRKEILDLRKDPEKAALLAAEFADENKRHLDRTVGGDIGPTELYLAHFMGAGGAAGFIKAYRDNPLTTAADLFPKAARANYNVFYDRKTGQARTLAGVYDLFAKKFGTQMDAPPPLPPKRGAIVPQSAVAKKPAVPNESAMRDFTAYNQAFSPSRAASRILQVPTPHISQPLVFNPADLMLLASMNLPTDRKHNE